MKLNKIFDSFPPPRFLSIPFVGLSISDSAVRCIQLGRKHGAFYLMKHLEKPIPPGVVSAGQINNPDELVNILESVRSELKINDIKVAISEENAYLFTAKLPVIKKEEVISAIESKIEENVPVPPTELIFDYTVLNHKEKDHLDVIVYAVPIKVIDSYVDVLSRSGFHTLSLEIESQTISRALLKSTDMETVLIVNFCLDKVGLYVSHRGVVRFSSTVPLKGDSSNNPGVLLQEVKKLYMYWHSLKENVDEPENKIEKVIVCGDSSGESIIPYLTSNLQDKVELGNVWINVFDINKTIPDMAFADSLKYAASIGLATSSDISI